MFYYLRQANRVNAGDNVFLGSTFMYQISVSVLRGQVN